MEMNAQIARSEYNRAYREKNRKRLNEYRKKWNKRNPEKVKSYQEKYWAKKARGEDDGKKVEISSSNA